MCGLCSTYLSPPVIDSCFALLSRRGPDDSGFINHSDIFLGHVRLSISDLSDAGHRLLVFQIIIHLFIMVRFTIQPNCVISLASKSIEVSTNCTELLYLLLVNFGIRILLIWLKVCLVLRFR